MILKCLVVSINWFWAIGSIALSRHSRVSPGPLVRDFVFAMDRNAERHQSDSRSVGERLWNTSTLIYIFTLSFLINDRKTDYWSSNLGLSETFRLPFPSFNMEVYEIMHKVHNILFITMMTKIRKRHFS